MIHLSSTDQPSVMSIQKSQIIFTKHALSRSQQRYVPQDKIEQVLLWPDKTFSLEDNKTKFIRVIDQRQFQVIASYLAKEDKWLVISAWVRGEEDSKPIFDQLLEELGGGLLWFFKQIIGIFRQK